MDVNFSETTTEIVKSANGISNLFKKGIITAGISLYYIPFIICNYFYSSQFKVNSQTNDLLNISSEVFKLLSYYLLFSGFISMVIYVTSLIGVINIKDNKSFISILYSHEDLLNKNKINLVFFVLNVIGTIFGAILYFMYASNINSVFSYDDDNLFFTHLNPKIYLKTELIIKIVTLGMSFIRYSYKYLHNKDDAEIKLLKDGAINTELCNFKPDDNFYKKLFVSFITSLFYMPFIVSDFVYSSIITTVYFYCMKHNKCDMSATSYNDFTNQSQVTMYYFLAGGIIGSMIYVTSITSIFNVKNKKESIFELFYAHEDNLNKNPFHLFLFVVNVFIALVGCILIWKYKYDTWGFLTNGVKYDTTYMYPQVVIKLVAVFTSLIRLYSKHIYEHIEQTTPENTDVLPVTSDNKKVETTV
jgi:NADH:ubiquinone oxidoreductase subunit K